METLKETHDVEKPRRVIKRYSNRKLYDTKDSRYVTLQQIGEMVRDGEEVQIIDNKTKEDKTEATLALILSEDLKNQPRSVPLGTLRTLIQERGGRLLSSLRDGPIGRLIPGGEGEEGEHGEQGEAASAEVAEAAAPAPDEAKATTEEGEDAPATKGRLTQLVEDSKQTVDHWQAAMEDRVLAIVPLVGQVRELHAEVARLTQRVSDLETALAESQSQNGKKESASARNEDNNGE